MTPPQPQEGFNAGVVPNIAPAMADGPLVAPDGEIDDGYIPNGAPTLEGDDGQGY